ncbi:hypothetical protein OIU84_005147 [Salix udensis]|uniref:Uncharacterized protein n=1 Tax=Salix udensis TaxID=889485 RepID=A0AAD6P0Y1_9ROSI|nr:hypothetical protein OIU84_005147 [Salix udensis]
MAISKLFIVSLVASLLVFHLVEADQKVNSNQADRLYSWEKYRCVIYSTCPQCRQMIVAARAMLGAPYPPGHVFARGLAGLAAHDATVSPKALPATSTPALAMPP